MSSYTSSGGAGFTSMLAFYGEPPNVSVAEACEIGGDEFWVT